ncbi:DNA-binding NarL/FixJ family response regulator [Streptomyces sp. V3I7]|nr:DNA-binding NarL/FixJ family response regulator [Streptomyces sp. V3I7]
MAGGERTTRRRTYALASGLVDDHALVRRGVRLVLDAEPDLEVVAQAGDGAEAFAAARADAGLNLAVLDIAMPAPPATRPPANSPASEPVCAS